MTLEAFLTKYSVFLEMYLVSFNDVTNAVMTSLKFSLCILIWPCRVILFSIHNYLTGRAYTYSLDDLCDLVIALNVLAWSISYIIWSKYDPGMTPEERQADLPHV